MAISPRQRRHVAAALLACLGAACGDGPTTPRGGALQVTVRTSGGDPDVDGYELVVGSEVRRPFLPTTTAVVSDISPGTHIVALERVAENCTVSGTHPRPVTVVAGRTVDVGFDVVCTATGISVTTRTSGVDKPDSYQVLVDNQSSGPVPADGSQIVSRLQPGTHTVALVVRDHCRVVGDQQIRVDVSARTLTPVLFEITCVPVVRSAKIAYAVDTTIDRSPRRWIGLVNPDGSGQVRLAPGDSPAWSPDGTKLVFSTMQCDFYDYYYYGALGCAGGLVVLDPEVGNVTALSEGKAGLAPAWQPAGDAIAFVRCCGAGYFNGVDRSGSLSVVEPGRPAVQLTLPRDIQVADPAWSPDGRRIAFTCVAPGGTDVCVVNRDGADFARLTSDNAREYAPAWSPDGSTIAFTTLAGGREEVAVMTPDGRGITRLTDGSEPAWSPDGAKLVFAGGNGLYTINRDGSNRTRLTTGNHHAPAWRP